jgi:hypothetical protein
MLQAMGIAAGGSSVRRLVGICLALMALGAIGCSAEDSVDAEPERATPIPQSDLAGNELRRERAKLRRERAEIRRQRIELRRKRRAARAQARKERQQETQQETQQAAPPAEPAESCHTSYDPCLDPSASDYDCEGGSGDGPNYTGPVTVKGDDPYDLDRDGDGYACES